MSVYVDDFRVPARVRGINARWSHLTADTEDELRAFAVVLGLKSSWIQKPGTDYVHFDVTDSVRAAAVAAGARSVTIREGGELLRQRRAAARATQVGGGE